MFHALSSLVLSASSLAMVWDGGTLDEALAKAKGSDRWVLVDVYAAWCGPCHEMDDKVWARDEVGRALQGAFVPLKRDGERGEGAKIAARYHVVGYPTLLVLDATGAEVDRLMGFVQPKDLIATLIQFRTGRGTLADLERKLKDTPTDDALRLEVATRHAMRGEERAAAELAAIIKADPDNQAKRAAPALLTLGKYFWLRGKKDYAHTVETLSELVRLFPATEDAKQAPYSLAHALHALKRDAEARAVLDRWIASAPKDVSRYSSYAWLCFKESFDRARGIEIAQQGLDVEPNDHGLWDTLAELYAVTGRKPEARDAATQALKLKPQDAYYAAQLRRFGGK